LGGSAAAVAAEGLESSSSSDAMAIVANFVAQRSKDMSKYLF
jgi:hypothetical protein